MAQGTDAKCTEDLSSSVKQMRAKGRTETSAMPICITYASDGKSFEIRSLHMRTWCRGAEREFMMLKELMDPRPLRKLPADGGYRRTLMLGQMASQKWVHMEAFKHVACVCVH